MRKKMLVAACFSLVVVIGYVKLGDILTLDYLATQEEGLRDYQQQHPLLIYVLAFVIYVAVTGLSIPGATVLSLLMGWFFGWLPGVVLVSFASTTGATVAFLLSRYLFRTALQDKFGQRYQQFNEALKKEGPFYLFTLRLIPAIPFFVINVVMGLTPLKISTYWWVSQLGMLPATIVYLYAGSSVPTLAELAERGTSGILSFRIIAALALLGVFPFITRYALSKFAQIRQQC
ncbi:MAG: TVP38/TMEM64 family protein [Planctomycetes bacterium]|nr:TVP38/TMEM64 family protein [Planctomycetota bacterium]